MRKRLAILLLCLSLTGCAVAPDSEFERERKHQTIASLKRADKADDRPFEVKAQSVVEAAAAVLKGIGATALFAAYLCAQTGYTPNIR